MRTTSSRAREDGRFQPRRRGVRVVVLILSGDPGLARESVARLFPDGPVRYLKKDDLKFASPVRRLKIIRSMSADAFVVFARDFASRSGVGDPLLELVAWATGSDRMYLLDQSGRMKGRRVRSAPFRILPRLCLEIAGAAALLALLRFALPRVERKAVQASRTVAPGADGSLKIAYLRTIGYPSGSALGGTASHTVGIVQAFGDLGHRVHVLSRVPAPKFDHSRVRVSLQPYGPTLFTLHPFVEIENHMRFGFWAWRILKADPPDFLYERYTRFDLSGPALSILLRRPLVLEHEGSEHPKARMSWSPTSELGGSEAFSGTLELFEHLNHAAASTILALSKEIRRDLMEERGVEGHKIELTPSGVDSKRFAPNSGGEEARKALGVPAQAALVGFSGSFGPWHGTKTLLEAILSLPPEPRFHFLFVGDGNGRAEMQMKLEEARLRHGATFTGLVPLDHVPRYLDACDILVIPPEPLPGGHEFYGSPTKLFEYMAAEKAIVASRLGQIKDVIRDEESGLLVEPGDAGALVAALIRLARDPELRSRLGRAARKSVVAGFSWDKNARVVLKRYAAASGVP